jgi:hypothetical protein
MDDEEFCVPDDVLEEASAAKYQMVPTKSKLRYQKELEIFTQWQTEIKGKDESSISAVVIFNVEEYTVCISKRLYLQVSRFNSLTSFSKTKCRNYQPKKATTSSRNDVCKFLLEAADQEWILQKVVLMMGIFGGRRD